MFGRMPAEREISNLITVYISFKIFAYIFFEKWEISENVWSSRVLENRFDFWALAPEEIALNLNFFRKIKNKKNMKILYHIKLLCIWKSNGFNQIKWSQWSECDCSMNEFRNRTCDKTDYSLQLGWE